MRGELGTITILLRRGYGGVNFKLNTGYTFKRILHLSVFPFQLRFIVKVLVLAPTALTK